MIMGNLLKLIIFLSVTYVVIIIAFSGLQTYVILQNNHLSLCFTEECFDFANKTFKLPLSTISLLTTAIPLLMLSIALSTYRLNVSNARTNNKINTERDFYTYLSKVKIQDSQTAEKSNQKVLFNKLFEFEKSGEFILSNSARKKLLALKSTIENKAKNYGSANNLHFKKEEHIIDLRNELKHFGIKIDEDIDNENYIQVEESIFKYIDTVIYDWFSFELELSKITITYDIEFRS